MPQADCILFPRAPVHRMLPEEGRHFLGASCPLIPTRSGRPQTQPRIRWAGQLPQPDASPCAARRNLSSLPQRNSSGTAYVLSLSQSASSRNGETEDPTARTLCITCSATGMARSWFQKSSPPTPSGSRSIALTRDSRKSSPALTSSCSPTPSSWVALAPPDPAEVEPQGGNGRLRPEPHRSRRRRCCTCPRRTEWMRVAHRYSRERSLPLAVSPACPPARPPMRRTSRDPVPSFHSRPFLGFAQPPYS